MQTNNIERKGISKPWNANKQIQRAAYFAQDEQSFANDIYMYKKNTLYV